MKTKATPSPYNYYEMIQLIAQKGKDIYGSDFVLHEIDRPLVLKLLAYFLRDEAVCESEGIDLHKGILLTGRIGCGKTSLMQLMRTISPEGYKPSIVSCRAISIAFGKNGYDVINRYANSAFYPYTNIPRVHCFDDLGLENIMTFWGNNCNVMAEILLSRYDLLISHKMITHITTNLNTQELEDIYGNRIRSRMRSMFNLMPFELGTPDKRR